MLKDYGTVISTRILRKPDGVSRGVGFARMESKEKCDAVINAFNGKVLPGKLKTLLPLMNVHQKPLEKEFSIAC